MGIALAVISLAGPQMTHQVPQWIWPLAFYGGIGAAIWFVIIGTLEAIAVRREPPPSKGRQMIVTRFRDW